MIQSFEKAKTPPSPIEDTHCTWYTILDISYSKKSVFSIIEI